MKLSEAELDQLAVFNELIEESIIKIEKIKTVTRINKVSKLSEPHEVKKLVLKKKLSDYNKYRKAKKEFVLSLEQKYIIQKGN